MRVGFRVQVADDLAQRSDRHMTAAGAVLHPKRVASLFITYDIAERSRRATPCKADQVTVVAGAALQLVITVAALERVIAGLSVQPITCGATFDVIGLIGSKHESSRHGKLRAIRIVHQANNLIHELHRPIARRHFSRSM